MKIVGTINRDSYMESNIITDEEPYVLVKMTQAEYDTCLKALLEEKKQNCILNIRKKRLGYEKTRTRKTNARQED